MSETTKKIRASIQSKREALRSDFDELEKKMKSAADWRGLFARHPGAMLAAAFGAGAVLAVMSGRRSGGAGAPASSGELRTSADSRASDDRRPAGAMRRIWEPVKDALIGVAVMRATGWLSGLLAGSGEEPKDKDSAKRGSSPDP